MSWFVAVCIAAGAWLLWILHSLRVRQVEARMSMRLAERERIARELQDTFLQSVQGLMLKFHAVLARMHDGEPSRVPLEKALEQADEVLAEGRDRAYEMRASTDTSADFPESLAAVVEELTPTVPTRVSVSVEGDPRLLHPAVREEAYRIGAEALRNAFRHAEARHIELEIEYSRGGLSLRITDDGCGFDVSTLAGDAPHTHFGLKGLSERAQRIRSQLEVSSRRRLGTEVELRVPAMVAFVLDQRLKGFAG